MSRHASPKKRNKAYRPKHVCIPITGLRDEFGIVLHSALTAAELGHFSKHQYDRIGQAINCIYGALILRPPKDAAVLTVIEGAMRAMNDAGRRGDATGIWVLRTLEQAAILAGIHKAEEHLPKMDVLTLYESMQRIKAMPPIPMQDAKQAFLGIDPAKGDDRTIVVKHKDGSTEVVDISEIKTINIIEMQQGQPVCVHKIVRGEEERTPA